MQNPVRLSEISEPEPTSRWFHPRDDDYATAQPRAEQVFLMVEVADTTVAFDRAQKAPLYALAGIQESWLVDLPADLVEVYRGPSPDGYRDIRQLHRADSLRPVAFQDLHLLVTALLPPP